MILDRIWDDFRREEMVLDDGEIRGGKVGG